jgi:hypothetical protein
MVKVGDAFASELEMLLLIMPNGDVGCSMDQDISCLQDRIREKAQLQVRGCRATVQGAGFADVEFLLIGLFRWKRAGWCSF